ncbi:MAG: lipocalin family protein [bacterium]
MKRNMAIIFIAALIIGLAAFAARTRAEMTVAIPQVKLPEDELPHDQPVEWWYYAGHLSDAQGRRYGVMASFFTAKYGNFPRQHFMIYQLVEKDSKKFYAGSLLEKDMVKMMEQVLAGIPEKIKKTLPSDMTDRTTVEKYHKYIQGKPIVKKDTLAIKYGDQIFQKTAGEGREWTTYEYKTRIQDAAFTLDLTMKNTRGPMFVGGVGNVGMFEGKDMFYYSFTRLDAKGVLHIDGEDRQVTGTIWHDHQYGEIVDESKPVGWDWFCISLPDGTDLNLSALRDIKKGDRFNRLGTVQWADGRTAVVHDVVIESLGKWTSKETGIEYPSGWMIAIPSLGMTFTLKPEMLEQEMRAYGPMRAIWEGACTVDGTIQGKEVKGDAYTELVGYGFTKWD